MYLVNSQMNFTFFVLVDAIEIYGHINEVLYPIFKMKYLV